MRQYLVEVYSSTCPDPAALAGLDDGQSVRYLRSIVIPGDETCLYLVLADSVEHVATAFEHIGLPADRIVDAVGLPAPTAPKSPHK
jgi:hypothetical protein